jgi:chromosome segregation ATPase
LDALAIVSLFGAVGGLGGLATALTAISSRRKLKAEGDMFIVKAADSLTSTAMRQLERLEKDVQQLTAKVAEYRAQLELAMQREWALEGRVNALKARVSVLEGYIKAQNLEVPRVE